VLFFLFYSSNTVAFVFVLFWLIGVIVLIQMTSMSITNNVYLYFNLIFIFISSKIKEHMGKKLKAYGLFFINTAFLLLFLNLCGLLPYTPALTGQFIFAFFISVTYFVVNGILGILLHKNKIFNLFLPKGVPLFIIPALILIEIISFFSRVLSLAIRLFANIVAGHILLKILISFLHVIVKSHISFLLPSILAIIGIFIIIILEGFIGVLQVYIFNLLLLIYLNGIIELH